MKKLSIVSSVILCMILSTSLALFAKDSLPWTEKAIMKAIKVGDELVYKMSGKDNNGFDQDYDFHYKVVKIDGKNIDLESRKIDPADGKQYGDGSHGNLFSKDGTSPYFSEMRPKIKVLQTEKLTVPAGNFDCTVVELKSMFGDIKTVWMINDKPGIYAKVTQDKLVYELKSIAHN